MDSVNREKAKKIIYSLPINTRLSRGEIEDIAIKKITKALDAQEALLKALIQKRSVDGLNGRLWDASKHLKAEMKVERLLKARLSREGGKK